ncbi:MAG: hypothetical protein WKF84_23155 [Pyrinomonadaceae bacterium]
MRGVLAEIRAGLRVEIEDGDGRTLGQAKLSGFTPGMEEVYGHDARVGDER